MNTYEAPRSVGHLVNAYVWDLLNYRVKEPENCAGVMWTGPCGRGSKPPWQHYHMDITLPSLTTEMKVIALRNGLSWNKMWLWVWINLLHKLYTWGKEYSKLMLHLKFKCVWIKLIKLYHLYTEYYTISIQNTLFCVYIYVGQKPVCRRSCSCMELVFHYIW